jgi:hypothetical protein
MQYNNRTALLADLTQRTQTVMTQTETLLALSEEALTQRAEPHKWNALECIEHLNLYGDFYLKEIEQKILAAPRKPQAHNFKTGWLGNKFALSLLPAKEGKKLNSMKTFKDKNTLGKNLTRQTLQRFLKQQERMLELLRQAEQVDVNKVRTGITISKWLTLKLGDTFRVVVYHNQRHLVQALKAAQA